MFPQPRVGKAVSERLSTPDETMRRFRHLSLFAVCALLLAACPAEDTPPPDPETPAETPADTPGPEPAEPAELTQECTNPEGFTTSYPEAWVTNEAAEDDLPPCSLFDPDAVDTGEATQVPADIAVFLRIEDAEIDAVDDPMGAEELERDDVTVDGLDGVRVETEATGEAMFPEGMRSTRYLVDLGGRVFLATTHDDGEPGYAEKQDVLAEMIDTITFTEPDGAAAEGPDPIGEPSTAMQEGPAEPAGSEVLLTDVRLSSHDGFDRFVLEFDGDDEPTWQVDWEDPPIRTDPAGEQVDVAGEAFLRVSASPATAVDLTGPEPEQTYDGPDRVGVTGAVVTEALLVTDHHGGLGWVLGLDREAPFATAFLDDPLRLVVDVVDR
jgi:hypothetical protein